MSGGTEAERVELRGHRGQAVDEVEVVAEGSSQQPAQLARAALEIRGAALATAVYISAAGVVPAPTGAVEAAVHVVQVLAAASVAVDVGGDVSEAAHGVGDRVVAPQPGEQLAPVGGQVAEVRDRLELRQLLLARGTRGDEHVRGPGEVRGVVFFEELSRALRRLRLALPL